MSSRQTLAKTYGGLSGKGWLVKPNSVSYQRIVAPTSATGKVGAALESFGMCSQSPSSLWERAGERGCVVRSSCAPSPLTPLPIGEGKYSSFNLFRRLQAHKRKPRPQNHH